MYDHEKSDPAIVAVKPTNKAGQPLRSWWSQGRGRGNVSQQSTGRAQYREPCHRRWRAYGKLQEKFTALFHHVSIAHSQRHSLNSRRMLQLEWTG